VRIKTDSDSHSGSDSNVEVIEIDDENEAMLIINYFDDRKKRGSGWINSDKRLSSNFNFIRK